MTITLSPDDAKALASAQRAEAQARGELELTLARAKVFALESARAKTMLFDAMAEKYDFDPDASFSFDPKAGTLTPV